MVMPSSWQAHTWDHVSWFNWFKSGLISSSWTIKFDDQHSIVVLFPCAHPAGLLQPPGYGFTLLYHQVRIPDWGGLLLARVQFGFLKGKGAKCIFVACKQDILTYVTRPEMTASANGAHITPVPSVFVSVCLVYVFCLYSMIIYISMFGSPHLHNSVVRWGCFLSYILQL